MTTPPNQLALLSTDLDVGAVPPALRAAAADAAKYVIARQAPSTRRAYQIAWASWLLHCDTHAVLPLPIHPAQLVIYLSEMSRRGKAPATVRLALTALSVVDQRARATELEPHPRPIRSHPLVVDWLKGWSREHKEAPQRQAAVVTPAEIEQLLLTAAERPRGLSGAQHVTQYARDRCMLLLGIAAAMRVSELVALDVCDVEIRPRGIAVYVRRGKSDQTGKGHVRDVVPQGRVLRCPIDAWITWLRIRGEHPGPAFVGIGRDGGLSTTRLDDASARRIIARRAKAANLSLVSSHSMRATFATLAHANGKSMASIAQQGNWRSYNTLRTYIRQGELFKDSPSSGLLDD